MGNNYITASAIRDILKGGSHIEIKGESVST